MSILRFLLLMLLSIIMLVSFMAALTGYRASLDRAGNIFDHNLSGLAHALKPVSFSDNAILHGGPDDMAIQVWQHEHLITHSHNAPIRPIIDSGSGFSEQNFNGQRWRVFTLDQPDLNKRIIVAQSITERIRLAEDLALASLWPLVIAIPVLGVLITLTITRSLNPLKKLSRHLRLRRVDDFEPIEIADPPAELQPVVDTINDLLRRVGQAFEREKRFSSDAAHELRTPISVLRVSIHNLVLQYPELAGQIKQLQSGVDRMAHVVEQILLLNRTQPDHFSARFKRISLDALCQQVIADQYSNIDARQQDIELESSAVELEADEFALDTLLHNLVGNASQYTPQGGSILVRISAGEVFTELNIEDSGPGIESHKRERVLDRFFRAGGDQHQGSHIGCGLGMAIVKQVCDLHHGKLSLHDSGRLGGLHVRVLLPLRQDTRK